jgi:hypothetical protein
LPRNHKTQILRQQFIFTGNSQNIRSLNDINLESTQKWIWDLLPWNLGNANMVQNVIFISQWFSIFQWCFNICWKVDKFSASFTRMKSLSNCENWNFRSTFRWALILSAFLCSAFPLDFVQSLLFILDQHWNLPQISWRAEVNYRSLGSLVIFGSWLWILPEFICSGSP